MGWRCCITGQLLQTLEGHDNWVNSVCVSPDGSTVANSWLPASGGLRSLGSPWAPKAPEGSFCPLCTPTLSLSPTLTPTPTPTLSLVLILPRPPTCPKPFPVPSPCGVAGGAQGYQPPKRQLRPAHFRSDTPSHPQRQTLPRQERNPRFHHHEEARPHPLCP